jgi:hypothetical protein
MFLPNPIELIMHSSINLPSIYVVSDVARFKDYTSIQSIMSITAEGKTGIFIRKHIG